MTGPLLTEAIFRDARYAFRMLGRTPAFAATAIGTLALVIGANTAVFSLANALLLKPLPYPEPDRLAYLERHVRAPQGEDRDISQDGQTWEVVRDRATTLEAAAVGASFGQRVNLVIGDAATTVIQARVSAPYFRVLGVAPAIGRGFTEDEDRAGGPAATVLSDGIWRRYFSSSRDIVGRSILLRGEPYVVVGVMPAGFEDLEDADLWTPLRASRTGEGAGTNFAILARPKPGISIDQATSELHSLGAAPFAAFKAPDDVHFELNLHLVQQQRADEAREPLTMLGAAVVSVLVIACVNLAALLLARGSGRTREIATRMALGGGRGTVVRQLLVEALVLSIAGGVLGIAVGQGMLTGMQALGHDTFGEWSRAAIDARALLVTLGLCLVTSLAFGLAPALQGRRVDVQAALAGGGSRSIAGGRRRWPRRALVVVEVALGVALLVTAAVLVRTVVSLRAIDPGFKPAGLATSTVSLLDARYKTGASMSELFDRSLAHLASAPGIDGAAISLGLPYERLLNLGVRFSDEAPEQGHTTNATYVAGDLFNLLGIPLRKGRYLTTEDRTSTAPVAVVNDVFAQYYSKDRDVIGRRIRLGGLEREIVGVVGDVQQKSSFYLRGMPRGPLTRLPLVYVPASQAAGFVGMHVWFSPVWIVRARSMADAGTAVRDAIKSVDPLLPAGDPVNMGAVMASAIAPQRLLMTLVGVLAGVAVFLAALGIHGLIAHGVSERTREFGIRVALGATPARTAGHVALEGLQLAAIGAVAGGVLSMWSVTLVKSFLWPAPGADLPTYLSVACLLFVAAGVASLLPALKVLRLDPAETLRG